MRHGWNIWSLLILLAVVLTVLGLFYQLLGIPGLPPVQIP